MKIIEAEAQNVPWEKELEERATKIHVIACKVAIVAVPAFFITDIFITPEHWKSFLVLRLLVSVIVGGMLIARRWIKVWHTMLAFVPFVLVSMLNAYMWSVMDVRELQMHSFSYIALFIAGGMLLLWRPHYTIKIVALSIPFNLLAFWAFSSLKFSEIMTNGGALTLAVSLFSVVLMNNRYRLTKEEIISRLLLKRSKEEVDEKNNEILDSITYAKRIQQALLPPDNLFEEYLPSAWVFYRPKDIVSGDFYLLEKKGKYIFFASADCTGHGVPGAMVSVICSNALQRAINEMGLIEPVHILDKVRDLVVETFERSDMDVKDGMDIAFCRLDMETQKVVFCGAQNPLYRITSVKGKLEEKQLGNEHWKLEEYKGDKQPIGRFTKAVPFTQVEIQLEKGDHIYISTDGYPDQFGGPKGRKFMHKSLKKLLLTLAEVPIDQQKNMLEKEFTDWMGQENQVDDVCIIGVKIV